MGQINTSNLPDYVSQARQAGIQLKSSSDSTSNSAAAAQSAAPHDDLQLTKLSGVLSSLKRGATTMRSQLARVMSAVQNGTYEVDPAEVSRSIVGESLASR